MKQLTSKERVSRTLRFEQTDRVPFGLMGTNPPEESRMALDLGYSSVESMYRGVGFDIWHFLTPLQYTGPQRTFKGKAADFWGVPLDIRSYGDSSQYNPLGEICSIDEVEAYPWPSIKDFNPTWFENKLDEYGDLAIEGGLWAPIFHNVTWLCGFENTLINLTAEPEISEALIRHVTDFWVDYAKMTLEAAKGRVMIMQNCNDFGTQRGLLMSTDMFRRYFKPALKRIYDTIKEYDVAVLQHSCGAIAPIIDDFIEIGADILNPIQVNAEGMDIHSLAERFGGRIVFYGGVDTQHVLPEGPEERIRCATRDIIDTFSNCGGLILSGSQGLEADISTEHSMYMFDEARKQSLHQ